ncbi:MAG: hypothetical protein F6K56_18665 [Moorea sp. SIO3G5]|nr:hypothetical protein [Moorena sp. SIO3G5]
MAKRPRFANKQLTLNQLTLNQLTFNLRTLNLQPSTFNLEPTLRERQRRTTLANRPRYANNQLTL